MRPAHAAREAAYFLRRRVTPGLRVGRAERVIDIGSGHKPFWRADVLFDHSSLGDEQRLAGARLVRDFACYVDGDITRGAPFRDDAFDVSYCSHLLEHVDDPGAAIDEITRISRRGYVEVPSGVTETAEPFVSHLWYVFRDGDRLVFVRKSKELHHLFSRHRASAGYAPYADLRDPFIRIWWEGKLEYEVVDRLAADERYEVDLAYGHLDDAFPADRYLQLARLLRRLYRAVG